MTLSAASLGRAPAAPSVRLLRWLRHCVVEYPSHDEHGHCRSRARSAEAAHATRGIHTLSRSGERSYPQSTTDYKQSQKRTSQVSRPILHKPEHGPLRGHQRRLHTTPTDSLGSAATALAYAEEELHPQYYNDVPTPRFQRSWARSIPNVRARQANEQIHMDTPEQQDTSAKPPPRQRERQLRDTRPPDVRIVRHHTNDGPSAPTDRQRPRSDGSEQCVRQVRLLQKALLKTKIDADLLKETYLKIPSPRIKYLPDHVVTDLLHVLRRTAADSPGSSAHYFTVMDDMVHSGYPPSVRDFTSALAWVGRSHSDDPKAGFERALDIFYQMERFGNRRADLATFNTLGDLALRANRLDVFKKLMNRIASRSLPEDRYTHMLRIRYWGLTKNAEQLKHAYRQMSAKGQVVDTIVLNCVIKYLFIAGDAATAEKTFERMKEIAGQKSGHKSVWPMQGWHQQKQLGKMLQYSSWLLQHDSERLRELQRHTPTSPNTHTYRLIVRHHCLNTKNLHRVVDLLEEMQHDGLFITRPIFYLVFVGFVTTPSGKFSPWNIFQLEAIFKLFIQYVKHSAEQGRQSTDKYDDCCELNGRTVEVVLQAYAEHASKERVREIWEHLDALWDASPATKQHMKELVAAVESGEMINEQRHADEVKRLAKQWDEDDREHRTK